jgi:opacity protein-like surface antigen
MKALKYSFLMIAVLILAGGKISGQFEQKVTLQVSWSYHHPLGEEAFTNIFNNGFSTDMGLQYNISRSFAIVALFKYTHFNANEGAIITEGTFNNFGISLCPKVRFFPSKKINPYIFAGGSMNYIKYSWVSNETPHDYKAPVNFGYTGGAGIDFKLSDRFALFVQGGYNSVFFSQSDPVEFKMNINSIYGEAGLHVSFFKSKSL